MQGSGRKENMGCETRCDVACERQHGPLMLLNVIGYLDGCFQITHQVSAKFLSNVSSPLIFLIPPFPGSGDFGQVDAWPFTMGTPFFFEEKMDLESCPRKARPCELGSLSSQEVLSV